MTRSLLAALLLLAAFPASASTDTTSESCLTDGRGEVEFRGRRYALRDETCRDLFLTDPERYSQLFDALIELADAGRPAPRSASLVPS